MLVFIDLLPGAVRVSSELHCVVVSNDEAINYVDVEKPGEQEIEIENFDMLREVSQ